MTEEEPAGVEPSLDALIRGATHEVEDWRWLWEGDRTFPIESHRGPIGRVVVWLKRLFRPLVKVPQNDLWERQRVFNLTLLAFIEHFQQVREDLHEVRQDLLRDIKNHHRRLSYLESFRREGRIEIMRHNEAIHALLDQKLDRIQRETDSLRRALAEDSEREDEE